MMNKKKSNFVKSECKNKLQRKDLYKWIILLFVHFLIGIYSYDLWIGFNERDYVTYQLDEGYSEQNHEAFSKKTYILPIKIKNPEKILIAAKTPENYKIEDYVKCVIKKDETLIFQGDITLENISQKAGILIESETLSGIERGNLQCELTVISDTNLMIPLSSKRSLQVTEYFDVHTYIDIGYTIIIANILILVINIILCSKVNVPTKFGVVASVLGVVAVFCVAPCSSPDEWRHFLRAYDIAQGNLVCTDIVEIFDGQQKTGQCSIPIEYLEIKNLDEASGSHWTEEIVSKVSLPQYFSLFEQRELSGETINLPMLGTYNKSPIEYFPQIIFIWLAQILKMSPIMVFYMARLGNVFFSTLLGWIALKLTPVYKNIFMCLFFLPTLTFLRGAVSNDALLFSIVLLLISMILYLKGTKNNLFTWKVFGLFVALTTVIGIIKLPYMLIIFGILLIQQDKSKNTKQVVYVALIFCLSLVFRTMINGVFSSELVVSTNSGIVEIIKYSIDNFAKVISLLVRTYVDTLLEHTINAVSWPIGGGVFIAYIAIIIWVSVCEKGIEWNFVQKAAIIGGSISLWATVIVAFYTLTALGSDSIWGIQGRYMIPVYIVLSLVISNKNNNTKNLEKYLLMLVFTVNTIFYINILERYWF